MIEILLHMDLNGFGTLWTGVERWRADLVVSICWRRTMLIERQEWLHHAMASFQYKTIAKCAQLFINKLAIVVNFRISEFPLMRRNRRWEMMHTHIVSCAVHIVSNQNSWSCGHLKRLCGTIFPSFQVGRKAERCSRSPSSSLGINCPWTMANNKLLTSSYVH